MSVYTQIIDIIYSTQISDSAKINKIRILIEAFEKDLEGV